MTEQATDYVAPVTKLDNPHDVISRVGNTPLFELKSIGKDLPEGVKLFGKAEFMNPGGSVKDRPALNMILDGLERGVLTKDKIILDSTSGNTGIAYAMAGSALGLKVRLCVPKNLGKLHKRILNAYGAELVFSPATEGSDGAIRKAKELFEKEPELYFYPDQYNNDANWQAHYYGTGVEILKQTNREVTHFVSTLGTSGTFTGTSKRLKEEKPDVKVISVQPDSPMHGLEGLKHMPTSIKPGFYNEAQADENLWVRTEDAYDMVKRVAREEGLLIGLSAGGAVFTAYEVAKTLTEGCVVTILCDSSHKYLDHAFWDED